MLELTLPLPPDWLIRGAVAAVWLYEGAWCKWLGREPGQLEVVRAVPRLGPRFGQSFLLALGTYEVGLGLWFLTPWHSGLCALVQSATLLGLNSAGLLFARDRIHDPAGMVLKNLCLLMLAWTAAALQGGAA